MLDNHAIPVRRSTFSVGAVLVIGSVGLFAFVDSLFLRVVPVQRVLYAAVLGACIWLVVIGANWIRLSRMAVLGITGWAVCVSLWLLPAATASPFYLGYLVGDVASMLAPAILLLAGCAAPDVFHDTRSLFFLSFILLLASVAAAALGIVAGEPRYEAPHDLLIVALWLAAFRSVGMRRLAVAALLLLVLVLALRSGSRTPVLLWILSGAYCAALSWSAGRTLMLLGPIVLFAVAVAGSDIRDSATEALSSTRFSQNVRGEADESLLARFHEAQDAVAHFQKRAGPMNYLLGFGHGSTFRPVFGPLRNMTPEGVVHNIHIGPVLIFYRYGLLGLLFYLWLVGEVVASFLRQRSRLHKSLPVTFPQMFFTLGLGVSLIDGALRNVVADPVVSFVVAGFLYQRLTDSAVTVDDECLASSSHHGDKALA